MFRTSKERAGAFSLRPPCCLLSFLNRQADVKASRRPHKVRDDGWHAGAEADHVLCHYPAMLGETQKPILPHPRSAEYLRAREKQILISNAWTTIEQD